MVFGKEFSGAIEQKQVAQQEAERQTYIVAKAEQEKRRRHPRRGEAAAAEIISRALEVRHGLIEVRRIDAAKEVLSARPPLTYLPSGGQGGGSNLSSGYRTMSAAGDGMLGVAGVCSVSCRAAFFFNAGLIPRRCESCERRCPRCCHHSAVYCGTAQRNS